LCCSLRDPQRGTTKGAFSFEELREEMSVTAAHGNFAALLLQEQRGFGTIGAVSAAPAQPRAIPLPLSIPFLVTPTRAKCTFKSHLIQVPAVCRDTHSSIRASEPRAALRPAAAQRSFSLLETNPRAPAGRAVGHAAVCFARRWSGCSFLAGEANKAPAGSGCC